MKTRLIPLETLTALILVFAAAQQSRATTFLWTNAPPSLTDWSAATNWSPNGSPGTTDSAVFGAGGTAADSVSINNIVGATTTITALSYTNAASGSYHVTQIPAGVTLTVTGGFTNGGYVADGVTTYTAMVDAGTFLATGPSFIVANSGSSGSASSATLNLSGLSNFVYSSSSGLFAVGANGARSIGTLVFAAASNSITAATMNFETSANSSSVTGNSYLGSGTNILNANAINLGAQRSSCSLQWSNTVTTGGLRIRGTGGTDANRSTMVLGNRTAGGTSGTSTGAILANGHPVDMKLGTLTLGWETGNGSPINAVGTLQFDTGTVDATTINMAICSGNAAATSTGNLVVGTNAVLLVGSGGISMVNQTLGSSKGNFTINGGMVTCSGNIFKANTNGVANLTNNGTLFMAGGNIGTFTNPIDNLSLSNSVLTVATVGLNLTNAVVGSLSTDPFSTTNIITIDFMPGISSYPATFSIIIYTNITAGIGGAGFNIGISNLPAGYVGYLTNDTSNPAYGQVNLVMLSGPIPKSDLWTGAASGTWNTSSLNWLSGGNPVAYVQGDFVTFDDTASGTTISMPGTTTPGSLTVSNNAKTYTFNGSGGLAGSTGLTKEGIGTMVLDNGGANTFIGSILIGSGTVQIGNNDANGSLGGSAITDNGSLSFARTDTPSLPNVLSGGGSLIQNGTGTLTVSAANPSFTGTVNVAQGTLKLGNNTALGTTNAGTTVASGATLDLAGFALTNVFVTASGAGVGGVGAISNSGASIFPALTHVTLANNATFGGANRWDIRLTASGSTDPSLASLSTAGNPYNLTKVGTNYVGIVNVTVDPALANIDIKSGTLSFQYNDTSVGNPASTLTVELGATLDFFNLTNLVNKVIVLNGTGTNTTLSSTAAANTNFVIGAITLNGNTLINASANLTLAGPIGGGGTLTSQGGSYLTLAGANSYPGATIVTNGTFALNSANSGGGLLTNSANSIIVGNGTNSGPVTISGTINPGDVDVAGTLTMGNLTLLAGATPIFDLSSSATVGGGVNDLIQVNGNLTANNNQITINFLQGALVPGTYRLFNYTGTLTGSFNPTVALAAGGSTRYNLTVDTSVAHQVNLNVSGGPGMVKWTAAVNNTWDVGITANWLNLGTSAADDFFQLDSVLLDDTAVGQIGILVSTNVAPLVITNNSTSGGNNFSLTGPGKITGSGGIVKLGTSTLMIGNSNDFQGAVLVQQGTLQVTNNSSLGATNGPTIISSGATLDLIGAPANNVLNLGFEPIFVSGSGVGGNGAIINSGTFPQDAATRLITLTGETWFGGPGQWVPGNGNTAGRWDMRGGGATLSTGGNAYNLHKLGSNQLSFVSVTIDTNLANIEIVGGALGFENGCSSMGNPADTLTVQAGATLELYQSGGATNSYTKQFVLNGDGIDPTIYAWSGISSINGPMTLNGICVLTGGATALTNNCVMSGGGGLTKKGSTLVLTAANTYTGPTLLSAGTLVLSGSGSIAGSTNITISSGTTLDVHGRSDGMLTLASGQTLTGSGSVWGNVTAGPGSVIAPGDAIANLLPITNNLTLNNNSNVFNVLSGVGDDAINVVSNLTLQGVSQLFIAPAGPVSVGQTFIVIQYGGSLLAGNESNLQAFGSPGFAFSVVPTATTPGTIQVQATVVPVTSTWRGGAPGSPTLWDTTTFNWTQNGGANLTNFSNGQFAVFDDNGTTNVVTLVGGLSPLDSGFQNYSLVYHLVGTGKLTGAGTLTIQGSAPVILDNSGTNDYDGQTVIAQGFSILQIGNNDMNGNIGPAGLINTGAVVFARADSVNISNVITGPGNLTNAGSGILTLSGNNSYAGLTTIAAGTLRINNNNALGGAVSGGVTVISNATLDIGGPILANNGFAYTNLVTVGGMGVGGMGAVINSNTNQQQNALRNVTLSGDTWFGGPGNWADANMGRWDIRGSITNATLSTSFYPYNLFKVGSNEVAIVGVSIDSGLQSSLANIDIQQGRLQFESGTTSLGDPNSNLTVRVGATLGLYQTGNTTNNWTKQFVLNGDGETVTVTNENGTSTLNGTMSLSGSCIFGANGTVLSNNCSISGTGSLTKTGTGRMTLGGTNTYSGNTTVTAGALVLLGLTAIPPSPVFDLPGTNATLDVNGAGGTLSLSSGQILRGNGTLSGSLLASAGSVVSPGESSVGTLSITNSATLQGSVVIDLDRSNPGRSGQLKAATVALGGTLTVNNIGQSALRGGDSFTLFSGTLSGSITVSSLPPLWPGLSWNTSTLNGNGQISVTGTLIPPHLASPVVSGSTVTLSGSGGLALSTYYVLQATNVRSPLSQWSRIATNNFDSSGNFSWTGPRNHPEAFYTIQVP